MILDFSLEESLTYYLIVVNFGAFTVFGIDKLLAGANMWRISEAALLTWALLGGTPGAYAARQIFRHKTRKQPFGSQLLGIAVLQLTIIAIGTILGWQTLFDLIATAAR